MSSLSCGRFGSSFSRLRSRSIMTPRVQWLLVGLFMLGEPGQASEHGEERKEKSGHCPPPLTKKLTSPALCGTLCSEDEGCPGQEKCCQTTCGHACKAPLEEKPGKCPRRQRAKQSPEEEERCFDTCLQDQQCPGDAKCCFSGCAMSCVNAQQDVSTETNLQ